MNYDPSYNCRRCRRLVSFRKEYQKLKPDWYNGPVDTWIPDAGPDDVKMLIIGLAPGLKGANRTGRAFTGDASGDVLFATLTRFGFASLGSEPSDVFGINLHQCAITNAVRCVPPQNKPVGEEINNCRSFLLNTLKRFPNLTTLVTLGKIAHDTTTRALGERVAAHKFAHNLEHKLGDYTVISTYHCSRYNINTGVLTPKMFEAVFKKAKTKL